MWLNALMRKNKFKLSCTLRKKCILTTGGGAGRDSFENSIKTINRHPRKCMYAYTCKFLYFCRVYRLFSVKLDPEPLVVPGHHLRIPN